MLILFSGCSGVGKNTVMNELMAKNPLLEAYPSYTTRQMRDYESEGNPYHFVSEKKFCEMRDAGEFFEHEIIHNNMYGTSKKLLEEKLASGKTPIKDIDVYGARNLKRLLKNEVEIVSIFLYVDSPKTLAERLTGRGETEIELRLKRYETEMEMLPYYDYAINNRNLDETVELVERIIRFEENGGVPACEKDFSKLEEEDIKNYSSILEKGGVLEPVGVKVCENKMTVCDGFERFAAGLKSGETVTRRALLA
ncbi:MAG: guanylate kinase [Firmicutes bacterium]|nr:guanylate kinase [Bacillota bacterium]